MFNVPSVCDNKTQTFYSLWCIPWLVKKLERKHFEIARVCEKNISFALNVLLSRYWTNHRVLSSTRINLRLASRNSCVPALGSIGGGRLSVCRSSPRYVCALYLLLTFCGVFEHRALIVIVVFPSSRKPPLLFRLWCAWYIFWCRNQGPSI